MKLLLVMDVDDDVAEKYDWFSIDYDLYGTNEDVCEIIESFEDAKVKHLSKKKNLYFHPNIVYANGWNDCLEEITK